MKFSLIDRETRDGRKVKSLFKVIGIYPEKDPKTLILPEEVEMLEPLAFNGLYHVRLVYLHNKITEIPNRCFQRSSVVYVRMSENVQQIYDYAFWNCKEFISTRIPEGCKLGVKSYTGDYVYSDTIFDGCPKHCQTWRPWIDYDIHNGQGTIMWEGGLLQMSQDLKNWEIVVDKDIGLYQYKLDGLVRTFRVVVPNEHPTERTKDSKYLVRSRIISLKE